MTSTPRVEANRRNCRNSSGPRSAAGKAIASRNARRHGLTARMHRPPTPTGEIERLARAICGQDQDPLLFGAAVTVAENYYLRRTIDEQRIAVIERLRDTTAIALAKGDNSFVLAKAKFMQAWISHREIESQLPKLLKKYNCTPNDGSKHDDIVPIKLKALLEEDDSAEAGERALKDAHQHVKDQERAECDALEEALPDLKRLERYERRARSQQKRAICELINIKLTRRIKSSPTAGQIDRLNRGHGSIEDLIEENGN